jgi:hypothetical protein
MQQLWLLHWAQLPPVAALCAEVQYDLLVCCLCRCLLCLQVTQSLVQHLNTNMKVAIDKADDAEADSVQAKQQVRQDVQQQCAACVMPPEAAACSCKVLPLAVPRFAVWDVCSQAVCARVHA